MEFRRILERVLAREELSAQDAEALMRAMVTGEATEGQVGGALMALAAKGCVGTELAAFAKVLRKEATVVDSKHDNLIDTCGTGGGTPSFNISTAAAIISSSAGARVAKHGNRGVTSACGSADVLEALGVRIDTSAEKALHMLDSVGLAFLFAPAYHPALKNVGKVRRELGVRTVFNQLGPLANPAGAKRQVIGVYDRAFLRPMAEALLALGAVRALVVHGEDGLDEVSPCAPTLYFKVWDGKLSEGKLGPADFRLESQAKTALVPGGSLTESATILEEAISDGKSLRSKAVLPSAAVALWISGIADSLPEGAEKAREAVISGRAAAKLKQLVEASQAA